MEISLARRPEGTHPVTIITGIKDHKYAEIILLSPKMHYHYYGENN